MLKAVNLAKLEAVNLAKLEAVNLAMLEAVNLAMLGAINQSYQSRPRVSRGRHTRMRLGCDFSLPAARRMDTVEPVDWLWVSWPG